MRETITTAGELVGGALVTAGCAQVSTALALCVAGTILALFSWLAAR